MIPKRYAYLHEPDAPRMIREALPLYGTAEVPGPGNDATIMSWARDVERKLGRRIGFNGDMIPWCGLFTAIVAVRAGWDIPDTPLWARAWARFGVKADRPSVGDILVFSRPGGGGHVGLYVAEDATAYHVLGGNQSDAVTITRIAKSRLIAARHPKWRVAAPAGRKPRIVTQVAGTLSTNEA